MILGIISDTHGHVDFTRPAVHALTARQAEIVIHCGDIGSVDIVRLFDHRSQVHFVFGNVDVATALLRKAIEDAGHVCHGRFGALELAGIRIAFLHGDDTSLLASTIESGEYQLVCHGHTHVARQHRQGPTLVINPGALFRADPHSLAIVRLPEMEAIHVPL